MTTTQQTVQIGKRTYKVAEKKATEVFYPNMFKRGIAFTYALTFGKQVYSAYQHADGRFTKPILFPDFN